MAKKQHGSDPIINAAFALAAEQGWRTVSLAAVAERAARPLAEVVGHFDTTTQILDAYAQRIDDLMLKGAVDLGESERDRLFDVVMRRFEAMQPDRRALASILRDTGRDPWVLACGWRRFAQSMALTLETAGISSAGLTGLARANGLGVLYLYALRHFLDDDSADLSRTMAAVDKGLRRIEGMTGLRSGRNRPAEAST